MKYIVALVVVVLTVLVSCHPEPKVHYSPSFKDDPVVRRMKIDYIRKTDPVRAECEERGITYDEYLMECDSALKDWRIITHRTSSCVLL